MSTKTVFFGARHADGTGLGAQNSISRSPRALHAFLSSLRAKSARNERLAQRRGCRLIPFAIALAWLALSPAARAVSPPPDGGYPGFNTAEGENALFSLTTGQANTANGAFALLNNTTGTQNTAAGFDALLNNTTGKNNIGLGKAAGGSLTTGDNNIAIGNLGVAGESNTIRIGANGTHTLTNIAGIRGATVASGVAVIVGTGGRLGTVTSSARFKDQIKPMDRASEAILALKPVTFRYKHALDPEGIPQFGLVAEQVEKVDPDLVARDEQGKVYSVRYEAVNAMLLNEFLKEHRKVRELEAAIAQQRKDFQKEIRALAASLKALQIQKVSGRLEVSKPAPQTAAGG